MFVANTIRRNCIKKIRRMVYFKLFFCKPLRNNNIKEQYELFNFSIISINWLDV